MKKNKRFIWSALLTGCIMISITACKASVGASDEGNTTEAEIISTTGAISGLPTETIEAVTTEELLRNTVEAIEKQYPEQTFTDMPREELDGLTLAFQDSYIFSGRISSEGWIYMAGVSKLLENPLEGMTCGTGIGVAGFNMSQFDNGKLLILENSDSAESDLSFLYDALQQGESGIAYLMEAGGRGVSLVPPKEGPFMKVSIVRNGFPVTEFIPLTESLAAELKSGEPIDQAEGSWSQRIAVSSDREELATVWNGAASLPTKEMVELAEEKSGFETGRISDLKDFTKASLHVNIHGEIREETIENRDDIEHLTKLLTGAVYAEGQNLLNYEGLITLTKQDGSEMTVQLALEGGGYVLGNSVDCELGEEDTKEIWSIFSRIDSFRKYGGQIEIKMTEPSFTPDSQNLTFTLFNDTGKKIDYILSPIIYKKVEGSWKQIGSISGFCGVVSPLEGESILLNMPWKDNYELEGPGTYKVEIQVMPEQDLRFEIADTFELVVS